MSFLNFFNIEFKSMIHDVIIVNSKNEDQAIATIAINKMQIK